jgi:hypothetical protein
MNQKRDALKKVVGVSAVVALAPSSWTKPIVSSIILPTHAMTSSTELRLNSIADIFLSCGDLRDRNSGCGADDSRVVLSTAASALSNSITFRMDIVYGQNIDENATYSVVNDPTESNGKLGRLYFFDGVGPVLNWEFGFSGNGPGNDDDEVPIATFDIILRVENPNGASATTSVNITFS